MNRTIIAVLFASLFGLLSFASVAEAESANFPFNCTGTCNSASGLMMNVNASATYLPGLPMQVDISLDGDDYVNNTCPIARFSIDGVAPYSPNLISGCWTRTQLGNGVSITSLPIGNAPLTPGDYSLSVSVGASGYRTAPAMKTIPYKVVGVPPVTYMLVAVANLNGSITPSGITTVNSGTNQTYAITPDAGYKIASVSVDGVPQAVSSTYTFTNTATNHMISATFVPATYTLLASGTSFGSVTPVGATTVDQGASQSYAITPDVGHIIRSLLVDDVALPISSTYTFTNVTADHVIAASFAVGTASAIPPSNPVLTCTGIGTANFTWDAVPGATSYEVWTKNTAGLSGWACPSGSGWVKVGFGASTHCQNSSQVNSFSFRGLGGMPTGFDVYSYVGSAKSVASSAGVRVCAAGSRVVTANAGANGSISPRGSVFVADGNSQSFAITPDSGHLISSLIVDGESKSTVNSYLFSNVSKDHSISVSFATTSTTTHASGKVVTIITSDSVVSIPVPPSTPVARGKWNKPKARNANALGGRVQAKAVIDILVSASSTSPVVATMAKYAIGTVISNPVRERVSIPCTTKCPNYKTIQWKKVSFDAGVSGWVDGSSLAPAFSAKFTRGSRAIVGSANARVRKDPNGEIIGIHSKNETGIIVGSPVKTGSDVWWPVNYASGTDGWVADSNLRNVGIILSSPAPEVITVTGITDEGPNAANIDTVLPAVDPNADLASGTWPDGTAIQIGGCSLCDRIFKNNPELQVTKLDKAPLLPNLDQFTSQFKNLEWNSVLPADIPKENIDTLTNGLLVQGVVAKPDSPIQYFSIAMPNPADSTAHTVVIAFGAKIDGSLVIGAITDKGVPVSFITTDKASGDGYTGAFIVDDPATGATIVVGGETFGDGQFRPTQISTWNPSSSKWETSPVNEAFGTPYSPQVDLLHQPATPPPVDVIKLNDQILDDLLIVDLTLPATPNYGIATDPGSGIEQTGIGSFSGNSSNPGFIAIQDTGWGGGGRSDYGWFTISKM